MRAEARPQEYTRTLLEQVAYKPTRNQAERLCFTPIEFIVDGEAGIRLSDALDGNQRGLQGRDDTSLFGHNCCQIIVRLQVRSLSTYTIGS